ncbi:MAG: hypothetical protein IPK19_10005 [Chloroflexi bacterium]|nr:hypothetical protein [Chloroflexota bacterium]
MTAAYGTALEASTTPGMMDDLRPAVGLTVCRAPGNRRRSTYSGRWIMGRVVEDTPD